MSTLLQQYGVCLIPTYFGTFNRFYFLLQKFDITICFMFSQFSNVQLWWNSENVCLFTLLKSSKFSRRAGKFKFFILKNGVRLPLYNSISGAYYCHPLSIAGCFVETSKCFRRCLQVSRSSSLLFSIVWGFSVSITSFSVKHRSQDWLPLENAWPPAFIDHTTLGVTPSLS